MGTTTYGRNRNWCFRDPCQNYQTKKAKIKKLEILIIKEIARIEKSLFLLQNAC